MAINSAIRELCWDISAVGSVEKSQQWVLSAMQKQGQGLVTMLWRILGNEQDVCDAYQQTFLQLAHFQNNGRDKPQNVKSFLYRTASNVAISMIRRVRSEQKKVRGLASVGSETANVDLAKDLDAKHLQSKLREAIAKLPDNLQNVIVLRDLAELPYEQVSKILGITVATARVYRHKAVTLLAARLT